MIAAAAPPARSAGLPERRAQIPAPPPARRAVGRVAGHPRTVGGAAGPDGARIPPRLAGRPHNRADLDGSEQIDVPHVLEALGYRLEEVAA